MKKLILTIAIILTSVISGLANTGTDTLYIPVSNVYTLGTTAEKTAESIKRNDIVKTYQKKGYTFISVTRTTNHPLYCNGLYIIMKK